VEIKQSVKFTLFRKITSILINKQTNMINVTILKKIISFVIDFGARALSTVACDVTGWFAPDGRDSNISIYLHFDHTLVILTQK